MSSLSTQFLVYASAMLTMRYLPDHDTLREDNMTVVLVPLPGWSKLGGLDSTLERREYRLKQVQGTSSRQKRM